MKASSAEGSESALTVVLTHLVVNVDPNGVFTELEFSKTEIQVYGYTAVVYSNYSYELEIGGQHITQSGRVSIFSSAMKNSPGVFVRASAPLLNLFSGFNMSVMFNASCASRRRHLDLLGKTCSCFAGHLVDNENSSS
jgi:hypothetical protein